MKNNFILLFVLTIFLFSQCKKDEPSSTTSESDSSISSFENDMPGLHIPLWAMNDTIQFELSEFFLHPERVTNVHFGPGTVDWNQETGEVTILTNHHGLDWITKLKVNQGENEYTIVVKKADDGHGHGDPTKTPKVNAVLYNNGKDVGFSYDSEIPGSVLTLWENREIKNNATPSGFTMMLPDDAYNQKYSFLRVFTFNPKGIGQELLIPLKQGIPVINPQELTKEHYRTNQMYFTFIDRFYNGNKSNDAPLKDSRVPEIADYMGGDLVGVKEKIEQGYFDSLSTNALWISPITTNPDEAFREYLPPNRYYSGYHGYWPISSTKIDPRYGTEDEFESLVQTAHSEGYNVFLDYVCNHVHQDHPIYKNHPEWATKLELEDGSMNIRIWDDQRLTTWFDDFLPTLDLSNPEVIEVQSDSALYWIKKYGLDGFRHDATKHIPTKFWKTLTRKIRDEVVIEEGRPVYQIGETYGSNELIKQYISTGLLDAQYDFNLFFTARDVFAFRSRSLTDISEQLEQTLKDFGPYHLMGNITGNHDQVRFMGLASGAVSPEEDQKEAGYKREIRVIDKSAYKRLHMLAAFTYTIPGIPVVYYGDEIGMVGAGDPDNRRMMRFDNLSPEEAKTLQIFRKLGKLRANSMPLLYGNTEILEASSQKMAIKRTYLGYSCILVINKGLKGTNFSLPEGNWTSNFGHEVTIGNPKQQIKLKPESFDILTNYK